jgi:hypothetical protein
MNACQKIQAMKHKSFPPSFVPLSSIGLHEHYGAKNQPVADNIGQEQDAHAMRTSDGVTWGAVRRLLLKGCGECSEEIDVPVTFFPTSCKLTRLSGHEATLH